MTAPPPAKRRWLRFIAWSAATLVGLPVALLALALIGLNTAPGQRLAGRLVASVTQGQVTLLGLHGRVPDRLRVTRLTLADAHGTWLTAQNIALDWSPLSLLRGIADIRRLSAASLTVFRAPEPPPARPRPAPASGHTLGIGIVARRVRVANLVLSPGLAGVGARFAVDGAARWHGDTTGEARLALRRLDAPGHYDAEATLTPATVTARLDLAEPPGGWLGRLAHLPRAQGALTADIGLTGPSSAVSLRGNVRLGALTLELSGALDVPARTDRILVRATSGEMRASVASWQALTARAQVSGSWTRPQARLTARVTRLAAQGASLAALTLDATLAGRAATVTATAAGIHLPGPRPDLLAAAPVGLRATLSLRDPTHTVHYTLDHALFAASGTVTLAPQLGAALHLDVPRLGPLAAAFGRSANGAASFDAGLREPGPGQDVATLAGTLNLTGGADLPPALIGQTRLSARATRAGANLPEARLDIATPGARLSASGTYRGGVMEAAWHLAAADLHRLAPALRGTLAAAGTLSGPPGSLAARLTARGTLAAGRFPLAPAELALNLTGLPAAPAGTLNAEATLYGAPLIAKLRLARRNGAAHLAIDQLHWKSLRADGTLDLPAGASRPVGMVAVGLSRLADLQPILGQPLSGALSAKLQAEPGALRVSGTAIGLAMAGTGSVRAARLNATLRGARDAGRLDARLTLEGVTTARLGADATLTATGPLAAPNLRLRATVRPVKAPTSQITATVALDPARHRLTLSTLSASAGAARLYLAQPARLDFGTQVKISGLRLALTAPHLAPAELAADGTLRPTLDLSARLDRLTAAHLRAFAKLPPMTFTASATARLRGALTHPAGSASLDVSDLRLPHDAGMPPAELTARAELDGQSATLTASAKAGPRLHIAVTGRVPLRPTNGLALRADGHLDLGLFNALAESRGLAVQGAADLHGLIAGTTAAPDISGTLDLRHGDFQDYTQGIHLADITLAVTGSGQTLRVQQFRATAGKGSITASGTVGIGGHAPIAVHLTADRALLLDSDLARVISGADLRLAGIPGQSLMVTGTITVTRADISLPGAMPPSIQTLDLRRPGAKPAPPPPPAAAAIGLGIQVDAPAEIFIRGRGLDAELGGAVRVGGTAAAPEITGGIDLRHGTFSLAGTTLNFTSGKIGFDGAHGVDPALDLVATSSTANVTATLTVGGYASAPKITLASVPQLPQDQVLAALLFGQSVASLSPLQLAEIGAALAQLAGIGGNGLNPLEKLRSGLGLDRLSVGSVANAKAGGGETNTTAAVQGGKYIAPGVFLGAKQGVSGQATQAQLQIDLTKRLKLNTDVGSGPGGNDIGLSYQFQY